MNKILVVGASSQVGRFLLPLLVERGYAVMAASRQTPVALAVVEWIGVDVAREYSAAVAQAETIVALAPLGIICQALSDKHLPNVKRIVAFSTTSVLTKLTSNDSREREAIEKLLRAESEFRALCDARSIDGTVFRPTLVYDGENDRNVAFIARLIRRFGFFPLIGAGTGKRQPVHAGDLAQACCDALENHRTFGCTYNLGGEEVLTYREMVSRIFASLGKKPRFVRIPLPVFRSGLRMARVIPKYRYLTPDMADRMNNDMVFDCTQAERDFDYKARRFTP